MLNIIKRLDRDRFEPAVAVLKLGGKLDYEVRRMGLELIETPFTIPPKPYGSLFFRSRQAAEVFKPYKFDLWHSFHYGEDYTEPLIAHFAGARGWVYTKKNMNWHSRAWLLRSMLAKRIAAQNSDMIKDFFDTPMLKGKARLIPRGVDLDKFQPSNETDASLHSRFGIADEIVLIGCVAHLVPVKGHPTLIDAVSRLEGVHLFLAGRPMDAEYTGKLHEQAMALQVSERVHFLDGVEDVPAFLEKMEIVVQPTWNKWRKEGCPVALLEAMACGKACVATDVPGSRDIIEDGVSGLLVEPENAIDLASAIQRLINDRQFRERIGKAARIRIEEHFSIEKEVAAHEKLYEEILARKGKNHDW